jgi:hypothetical protein
MSEQTVIPVEARYEALGWTLARVRESYEEEPNLEDAARLVNQVADAVEREDRVSVLVYGMRLLSEAEVIQLWEQLESSISQVR